jgi:hypothetical protein
MFGFFFNFSAQLRYELLFLLNIPQVMGQNFALNMASKGFTVAVCNRSPDKVDTTVERAKSEGGLPMFGFKVITIEVLSFAVPNSPISIKFLHRL